MRPADRAGTVALVMALMLAACGGDAETEVVRSEPAQIDSATGLIMAEGWELVATYCVACHSTKQFLRQRGTARTWQSVIDWMQSTQGLAEFPAGVEPRIVAYLAANYGPRGSYRRAPIPADLMPANPYAGSATPVDDPKRGR